MKIMEKKNKIRKKLLFFLIQVDYFGKKKEKESKNV